VTLDLGSSGFLISLEAYLTLASLGLIIRLTAANFLVLFAFPIYLILIANSKEI
jgi:hypothetical protein